MRSLIDFDFVVSLDIGEPKLNSDDTFIYSSSNVWKNEFISKLYNIIWEKMRDRKIK